jgi:hypothetical protein
MTNRRSFLKELTFATMGAAFSNPRLLLRSKGKGHLEKSDSLPYGGHYRIYDVSDKKEVDLSNAIITQDGRRTTYELELNDINVHSIFFDKKDYIIVEGEIENKRKDSRGFILDYQIPIISPKAVFSNGLEQTRSMIDNNEEEGNVFPISAMCDEVSGVALAIPPSQPRQFGIVSSRLGMSGRFYLGVSPVTKQFPNKASFAFILYKVDPLEANQNEPGWAFRSALSQYYRFYNDYYSPRVSQGGLWMFEMKDKIPPNVEQFGFDEIEPQWGKKTVEGAISRDTKYKILSFPYTIVGQREIKFLPSLPKTYSGAMRAYANWSPTSQPPRHLTKENDQGDFYLKNEITSSACLDNKGRYIIVIRDTNWGGNSVSFKVNPNPKLFENENRMTVGGDTLKAVDKWLNQYPAYDGVYVDSLGPLWLGILNYREEHFAYANYPLTVDSEGKTALHNTTSHYEYLENLREKMKMQGRLVMGNAIYAYNSSTSHPEHYRKGTKLGRFFCAALLDIGGSESGVHPSVDRCEDVRGFMGKKPYAYLNYYWEDENQVETFVNKSLCYGIFAGNTKSLTGDSYYDNPYGYTRDKRLYDWYLPLVRKLTQAGWEPRRYATVSDHNIKYERFGSGDETYFTLYNDSAKKIECILNFNTELLGFTTNKIKAEEIARNASLKFVKNGSISFTLESQRTYVIKIS